MCISSLTTHILPMALLHLPTLLFDFRVIVRKYSNFSNISAGSCHLYKASWTQCGWVTVYFLNKPLYHVLQQFLAKASVQPALHLNIY
jgi:hypothetical protein